MKIFLIVLLAAASGNAQNLFCDPRSTFKLDCNTCTCSADGKTVACTDMVCGEEESANSLESPKQVCNPRSAFTDYCNTCSCAEDGFSFSCTKMTCDKNIWNKDGSRKSLSKQTSSAPKNVCEPGSYFKDYCNTCACAADGQSFACTMMDCNEELWNKDGSMKVTRKSEKNNVENRVCKPGTLFKNYCNTCSCAEDGLSYACTKMVCDENIWNKDGSIKRMLRRTLPASKKVCKPGFSFRSYCNTCFCAEDGMTFSCTRTFCEEKMWNQDGSSNSFLKTEISKRSIPKQVCEPKSLFKSFCNTCTCAEDGLTFSCTRMFCDENIWNEDGSSKVLLDA